MHGYRDRMWSPMNWRESETSNWVQLTDFEILLVEFWLLMKGHKHAHTLTSPIYYRVIEKYKIYSIFLGVKFFNLKSALTLLLCLNISSFFSFFLKSVGPKSGQQIFSKLRDVGRFGRKVVWFILILIRFPSHYRISLPMEKIRISKRYM